MSPISRERRRDYARARPAKPRPAGKVILIVTEGKKTEPGYFNALRERLRLSPVNVEIAPEGADPLTLAERALERNRERIRTASAPQSGFWRVPFDEVWIVHDLEGPHHSFRTKAREAGILASRLAADRKPEAANLKFAASNPSFEFWLLLHFERTTRPLTEGDRTVRALKAHWPAYKKAAPVQPELLEATPRAVANAEACRKHHAACGGDGDPSTDVDQLVRSLNAMAAADLAFDLD